MMHNSTIPTPKASQRALLASTLLLFLVANSAVAQVNGDEDVLAVRGKGVVTHEQFNARAQRIPEEHRFPVIRNHSRMEDLLNEMLLTSQLAADAGEAGFDQDPEVIERMKLAAREELAKAWLEHVVEEAKPADYSAMAREEWLLNRDKFRTEPTVDVTHLLVGLDGRTNDEALTLARELHAQVVEAPDRFDELVMEHSDDPSASKNRGSFTKVKKGMMVKPFEEKAFSMTVGDISEPVKTDYGYHLIRLDGKVPSRRQSFNEVRLNLEQRVRAEHNQRIRDTYLAELHAEEAVWTKESLENTVERVFGPDVMAKYAEEGEAQ